MTLSFVIIVMCHDFAWGVLMQMEKGGGEKKGGKDGSKKGEKAEAKKWRERRGRKFGSDVWSYGKLCVTLRIQENRKKYQD